MSLAASPAVMLYFGQITQQQAQAQQGVYRVESHLDLIRQMKNNAVRNHRLRQSMARLRKHQP
jgi:hypothetical protein